MSDFSVVSTIVYSLQAQARTITVDVTVDSARVIDGTVTVIDPVAAGGDLELIEKDGGRALLKKSTGEEWLL